MRHPYIPHTEQDIRRICNAVGIGSVEELFSSIPAGLREKGALALPEGLSEKELKDLLTEIAARNSTVKTLKSFLGAGSYNHYIPAAVGHIAGRSEFYTSYTPYQPEVSQGTLQAIFEYQTLICQLTGMDVSNASLYDGSTATAEAALMAKRITNRKKVLLSAALHPEYREVARTYLGGGVKEVFYCTQRGTTLEDALKETLDEDTACLIVQQPNFFGSIEDLAGLSRTVHSMGALFIVTIAEPLSLAILRPPGAFSADIVVGEGRSFGTPPSFGGPCLGFMATKENYIRQMPGRIVGETVDRNNKRAFCLTFATREQHIRREKATSNICTNEGLLALGCSIYLSLMGKEGLRNLAHINLSKAVYLKERLRAVRGIEVSFASPVFNEFVIEADGKPEGFLKKLLERGILGGVFLGRFYPELNRHILVAVTEMNSKEEIELYAEVAAKALE
jgi:glycine dehydrogenase subunit 1